MSSKRQGAPLIEYSDSPVRHSALVMQTSEKSIGNKPAELSMVSDTSARPSRARFGVPAKITSSILEERKVRGPCGAEHPGHGVHDVGLAGPVRADDDRNPRLELEGGGIRKGLEALQC